MRVYRSICTLVKDRIRMMTASSQFKPEDCNCFVVRSAARHVTQLYDQFLAPVGLHVTQFSVLAKLKRLGPTTSTSTKTKPPPRPPRPLVESPAPVSFATPYPTPSNPRPCSPFRTHSY